MNPTRQAYEEPTFGHRINLVNEDDGRSLLAGGGKQLAYAHCAHAHVAAGQGGERLKRGERYGLGRRGEVRQGVSRRHLGETRRERELVGNALPTRQVILAELPPWACKSSLQLTAPQTRRPRRRRRARPPRLQAKGKQMQRLDYPSDARRQCTAAMQGGSASPASLPC